LLRAAHGNWVPGQARDDTPTSLRSSLTRKDLKPLIGSRTSIAEVINPKRGLSIEMIRRLHNGLGISAEVLIRPSRDGAA